MKKFPVTVIDNFFDHPDIIRNWALTLDYSGDPDGRYPGSRTKMLSELSSDFSNQITQKILNLFYDFETCGRISWSIEASFQKVSSRRKNTKTALDEGWIHSDCCEYSGVIYLNKDFPPGTGTSIYKFIGEGCPDSAPIDQKFKFYKNEKIDEEEYLNQLKNNNENYVETVRVENVYNRMVLFEGGQYHGVPTFHTKIDEDRLTLVFFLHNLKFHNNQKYPITRLKQYD